MTHFHLGVKVDFFCIAPMNNFLKLAAIPLILTLTEGCGAPFHNAIRSVRSNVEMVIKGVLPKKNTIIANGMSCQDSLYDAERVAKKRLEKDYPLVLGKIEFIRSDYCAIAYVEKE